MIIQPSLAWRLGTQIRTRPHRIKLLFQDFFRLASSCFPVRCYSLYRPRGHRPQFNPSDQQREIVRLCFEQNVVVSARPGSGKTATAEAIVAAHPDKRVAVLTYSKRLQLETYLRLRKYSNCEVFTFHGMAGLLLNALVYNDAILSELREDVFRCNELPRWSSAPFDIIVLDEFQDCTPLIFWLTNCFILANTPREGGQPPRIVVLGDERQSIYQFRGADHRYLTLAPEILAPISPYPFIKVTLGESFRLSNETTQFVNDVFLGGESYVTGSKPGPKPIVLRYAPRNDRALAQELSTMIKHYGAKNSAILAPYVRQSHSLKRLINRLSEKYHIPIAVPTEDDTPLDDRVAKGKMCLSTIHQFKGCERDLVVLFGVDSSFFEFAGRSLPDDRCPNEIFVALTRAKTQLVFIHDESKELMPFVSVEALYRTAKVVNMVRVVGAIAPPDAPGRPATFGLELPSTSGVRDMTRHIRSEDLDEIIKRNLCIQQLSPPLPKEECINMISTLPSDPAKGFHEAVSDINGLVVVAAFEHHALRKMSTLGIDKLPIDTLSSVWSEKQISWLCRRACEYEARISGYNPRANQMKNHKFNWIRPADLTLARNRLQGELRNITSSIEFEVDVKHDFIIDNQKTELIGRADVVSYGNSYCDEDSSVESVWEIKFVSQLSYEHIIQACVYAYTLEPESYRVPRIILYNVRDGEKIQIVPRDGREGLRRMIESVLRLKWTSVKELSDEEFIGTCVETTQRVNSLDRSQ
ncbi:P-loop containing nucleoside triphosphate hydrolase protein [Xylaria cf. heliscus]|nr:P-loop containing nucleoside triphosphate hydrolase protein [Xylaria cf. heliscus]